MKVGDLVRVGKNHWHMPGEIGIIVQIGVLKFFLEMARFDQS